MSMSWIFLIFSPMRASTWSGGNLPLAKLSSSACSSARALTNREIRRLLAASFAASAFSSGVWPMERFSITSPTNSLRAFWAMSARAFWILSQAASSVFSMPSRSDLSTSRWPPSTCRPLLRTSASASFIVFMSVSSATISSFERMAPPRAWSASSFSASGRILSAICVFMSSSASAVPCMRIASRGMSSENVAESRAFIFGSPSGPAAASCSARSYMRAAIERISVERRSAWNCISVKASCSLASTLSFAARRPLNFASSSESACCALMAAVAAFAAAFDEKSPVRQTRTLESAFSGTRAFARSAPENASSALSVEAAFFASSCSFAASLAVMTCAWTSAWPTVVACVPTASAATDRPAPPRSSTSSFWMTSEARGARGGSGTSGAAGGFAPGFGAT